MLELVLTFAGKPRPLNGVWLTTDRIEEEAGWKVVHMANQLGQDISW